MTKIVKFELSMTLEDGSTITCPFPQVEQLLKAAEFSLSVHKAQGLFDISERKAYNKLALAVNAMTNASHDMVPEWRNQGTTTNDF